MSDLREIVSRIKIAILELRSYPRTCERGCTMKHGYRNMNASTVLLVLAVGVANAQLNFDGNPLTENTEYTAEESQLSRRTARREETAANATNGVAERSQNFHLGFEAETSASWNVETKSKPVNDLSIDEEDVERHSSFAVKPDAVQTGRHLTTSPYVHGTNSINPSELALSTFLNSKTPEESRQSLDDYLQIRESPQSVGDQATSSTGQQQPASLTGQQSLTLSSPVNQHLTAQLMQQREMLQTFPVNHRQQFNEQVYNANTQDPRSPVPNTVGTPLAQQAFTSYAQPGIQSRNDLFYPAGWHHRVRRIRGRPLPYAQSRGGFYNGPVPGPFKPKAPVEVIYTKPPGFGRGPPVLGNPPVPYEDASAWFPEADHPPPAKDVYYSQLYAQSYDPYYYNYIAKTGKVKPHLYGKLGKYHEDEGGDGIWGELYRGFKKHGLKNMMTPTFLLGMTLPVVTLMLTALVQKRSFARSDSGEFSREETIQEYLEQLQRAIECYEKKRRKRDANADECWKFN
ncbi:uncharacterized protein LOC128890852 isoform X1 [Hylaeus anthracinus]|uniref:uncharacterized protein LOC128890852 isoform X1 n=2 Tax=Hylaeus anthracinus TaxID=313031 RepID=UPI0023B9C9D1|nr:uncharacterized protein LOC128890852 isoform X1 [Hylaeus anthracinus]